MRAVFSARIRVALVVALALVLCGCAFWGEPASTEDLLVRYAANPQSDNFVAMVEVDVSVTAFGLRVRVPVTGQVEAGGTEAKGAVDVDLTDVGDAAHDLSLYATLDGQTAAWYVGVPEGEGVGWRRAEVSLPTKIDIIAFTKFLSEAEFSRMADEADEAVRYELTMPAAHLVDAVMEMGEVTTSFGEVDRDELDELLGDSRVHFYFTGECLLHSAALDVSFEHRGDEGLASRPVTVRVDAQAKLDGYGTVDATAVALPEEVRDAAQLTDDPLCLDLVGQWAGDSLGL